VARAVARAAPRGPGRRGLTAGRIYLVGFMGSGKTSVGLALASRLGVPFVDLDQALEAMAGRTVRELFEKHGEPWFREREAELLRGTADLPDAVIALGGGTFVDPRNAEFIRAHGRSVFLDVPFDLIASRLQGKSADRPLFRSVVEARNLYEARIPCYNIADRAVSVSENDSVNAVAERLERLLGDVAGAGGS